jgi:hypothetical protein
VRVARYEVPGSLRPVAAAVGQEADHQAHLGLRARQDHLVRLDRQGPRDRQTRRGLPVRVVRQAHLGRLQGLQVVQAAVVGQVAAPVEAGTQVGARSDVEEW